MGVARALNSIALQTIAHRVGSHKDKNIRMADKKTWAIQTSWGRINRHLEVLINRPKTDFL